MDDLNQRLAATVEAWMIARRLNKLQLAQQAGLGRQTVHRLLKGENTDLATIKRIADFFGTTAAGLLIGELPTTPRDAETAGRLPVELGRLIDAVRGEAREAMAVARKAQATADEAMQILRRRGFGTG